MLRIRTRIDDSKAVKLLLEENRPLRGWLGPNVVVVVVAVAGHGYLYLVRPRNWCQTGGKWKKEIDCLM